MTRLLSKFYVYVYMQGTSILVDLCRIAGFLKNGFPRITPTVLRLLLFLLAITNSLEHKTNLVFLNEKPLQVSLH